MSKNYLTQSQALTKISLSGGGSSFCTKAWLVSNGNFDTSKLTNYENNDFVVDDDIVKKATIVEPIYVVAYIRFSPNLQTNMYDSFRINSIQDGTVSSADFNVGEIFLNTVYSITCTVGTKIRFSFSSNYYKLFGQLNDTMGELIINEAKDYIIQFMLK